MTIELFLVRHLGEEKEKKNKSSKRCASNTKSLLDDYKVFLGYVFEKRKKKTHHDQLSLLSTENTLLGNLLRFANTDRDQGTPSISLSMFFEFS